MAQPHATNRTVIRDHACKVSKILSFLEEDPAVGIHVLLLTGVGGTGKTSALQEALHLFPFTEEAWNIIIWNQGEAPGYCRFHHTCAPNKWVVIRFDGDDMMSRSMIEEWEGGINGRVESVEFVQDPVYGPER